MRPQTSWTVMAVLLASCGGPAATATPTLHDAPPPASAAAPVVRAPAPVPAPPPSEWAFEPRFRLVVSETTNGSCFPAVMDVAPLADGGAWIVGGCGLRVRLTADGKHEDFSERWQVKAFDMAQQHSCCPSFPLFSTVLAGSDGTAFTTGTTSCGLDPSLLWHHPLERFSGKWTAEPSQFRPLVHDASVDLLFGDARALYALSRGVEDGPGPGGLYRLDHGRWAPVRESRRAATSSERFDDAAVSADGRLWLAGSKHASDGDHGLLLYADSSKAKTKTAPLTWNEETLGASSLFALSIGEDGSVWIGTDGGKALWRRTAPEAYLRYPLPQVPSAFVFGSLLAKNDTDVWLGGATVVQHFKGTRFEPFPLSGRNAGEGTVQLRRAGDEVWAFDSRTAWQLAKSSTAAPAIEMPPRGVTDEEYAKGRKTCAQR